MNILIRCYREGWKCARSLNVVSAAGNASRSDGWSLGSARMYKNIVAGLGAVAAVFFSTQVLALAQHNFVSATQSSDYGSFTADVAIDGDLSTFNHTQNQVGEWWVGDLGRLVNVEEIRVHNRGSSCCTNRLNANVYGFINDPRPLIENQPFNVVMDILEKMREPYWNNVIAGDVHTLNPSSGDIGPVRYVMLIQQNSDYLHVDEVQVYGEPFGRGKGAGGQAIQFQQSTSGLSFFSSESPPLGKHWTLSARFNDLINSGARTLFNDLSGSSLVFVDASGLLGVRCIGASCGGQTGDFLTDFNMNGLDDGGTHTITAVGSGDTTTYYIDGVEVGSVPVKPESEVYGIGNNEVLGQQRFAMLIDDVQIHTVALTDQEIVRIAHSDVVTRGLVSHYDFDGPSGSESLFDDAHPSLRVLNQGQTAAATMPSRDNDYLYINDALPIGATIEGQDAPSNVMPWVDNQYISGVNVTSEPQDGYYFYGYGVENGGISQLKVRGLSYKVKPNDVFSTWVKTVDGNLPGGIQIQLKSAGLGTGRVTWGDNLFAPQKQINTAVPDSAGWVNLRVPMSEFGMDEGYQISELSFTHSGGILAWDNTFIGGGELARGLVKKETWTNMPGNTLQDLFGDYRYPYNPSSVEVTTTNNLTLSSNAQSDNSATKISGYISPPAAGNYTFWITAGDQAVLRIAGTNEGVDATQVAFVPAAAGSTEWDKFPQQQSQPLYLSNYARYYFEVIVKEGTGTDHVNIHWSGPGISKQEIDDNYLSMPVNITEGWTKCAFENEICDLPFGKRGSVRFGAYGNYEYLHDVDSAACGVLFFGLNDPLPGKPKHCEYMVTHAGKTYFADVAHGDVINLHNYIVESYDQNQDKPNTGPVAVEDNGTTLFIQGNRWQKIKLPKNYQVTANTVLEFDFFSTAQGDIQGIGFDTDDSITGASSHLFQVYGTQNWGIQSYHNYSSGTQTYKIKVGDYFTGPFAYLTFVADDDSSSPYGNSTFSNIKLYEENNGATAYQLSSKGKAEAYFAKGDILRGDGYYAKLDNAGNLLVLEDDSGAIFWQSQTSVSDLQMPEVKQSAFHANCDTNTEDGCLPGSALIVADDGVRIVDRDGQIVWRPDLGDLSEVTEGLSVKLIQIRSGGTSGDAQPALAIIDNKSGRRLWDSHFGYHPKPRAHAEVLVTPTNRVNERFYDEVPLGNRTITRQGFQTYAGLSYTQLFDSTPDGINGSPFEYISEQQAARGPDYVTNADLDKGILKNIKGKIDYLYSEVKEQSGGGRIVYRAHLTNTGQLELRQGVLQQAAFSSYLNLLASLEHPRAAHKAFNEVDVPYTYVSTSGPVGANGDYYLIMTTKGFQIRNAETHAVLWDKDVSLRAPGAPGYPVDQSGGIGSYMLTINHNNARIELHQSDYTKVLRQIFETNQYVHNESYPTSALAWHSVLSTNGVIDTLENVESSIVTLISDKFKRLYADLQNLGNDVIADSKQMIHDIRSADGDADDGQIVNLSALLSAYNDLGRLEDDLLSDGLEVAIDAVDIALLVAAVVDPQLAVPLETLEKGFYAARSAVDVVHTINEVQEIRRLINTYQDMYALVDDQLLVDFFGDNFEERFINESLAIAIDSVNDYGEHVGDISHDTSLVHNHNYQLYGDRRLENEAIINELDHWGHDLCNAYCRMLTKKPLLSYDVAMDAVHNNLQANAAFSDSNNRWLNTNKRLSHVTFRPLLRLQPRLIKFGAGKEYVKERFAFVMKVQVISARLGFVKRPSTSVVAATNPNYFGAAGPIDSTDYIFRFPQFQDRRPGSVSDDRELAIDFASFVGGVAWYDYTFKNWLANAGLALNFFSGLTTTIVNLVRNEFNADPSGDILANSIEAQEALDGLPASVVPTLSGFVTGFTAYFTGAETSLDVEMLIGAGSLTRHRLSDLSGGDVGKILALHYGAGAAFGIVGAAGVYTSDPVTNPALATIDPVIFGYGANIVGNLAGNIASMFLGDREQPTDPYYNSAFALGTIAYVALLTTPNATANVTQSVLDAYNNHYGLPRQTAHPLRIRQRNQLTFGWFYNFIAPTDKLKFGAGDGEN